MGGGRIPGAGGTHPVNSCARNRESTFMNDGPLAGRPQASHHPASTGLRTVVYRPNQRHELGLFRTWAVMAGNIWRSRELIWQLFKRDFFAAYKKSFVGVAWIFLAPLAGIVSWVFFQMTGMLQPGDVGMPYPAYVLIGTTMFGLFMGLYAAASGTLAAGQDMILQVNYPHEALLFKQTGQQAANFLIALVLNILVLVAFGVVPHWRAVLLPLVALPVFFLAAALGLMISMISVVAVDVSRIVEMALGFLLYATPVIYADTIDHPFVQAIITWNPLTHLICSCRDVVLYGRLYEPAGYALSSLLAVAAFLLSWRLFYVSEEQLVERMV